MDHQAWASGGCRALRERSCCAEGAADSIARGPRVDSEPYLAYVGSLTALLYRDDYQQSRIIGKWNEL